MNDWGKMGRRKNRVKIFLKSPGGIGKNQPLWNTVGLVLSKTAAKTSNFVHNKEEEKMVSPTKAETDFAPTAKLQKAEFLIYLIWRKRRVLLYAELNSL